MPDIPCIYKMDLVDEKDVLKEDLLKGKAFDILLSLLAGSKSIKDISKELNVPSFSVQLYIKRLIDAKLVKVKNSKVVEGKIEKCYELVSTDIQIINYLKESNAIIDDKKDIELLALQFSSLTKDVIKNINKFQDKPHKIKAYFIKADEEKIAEFKKELDALFEKYQSLEDLSVDDTYGFISVLAPYKIE
ncbi:hypothetical protein JYG23_11715 [Sedimentibacter sp. zth1]|uniref:hypothetical protein n=1 Tax=Sedimentibacter sp. zth1 TaxID=2816908 RepID=UPI001A92D7F0|nr:hypothetical protein [Sedimentibacter sp. zth1]QSX05337.1 hypothetical protein JYG23_11715 [Sedimentibacter sp. zth1]